MFDLSVSIFAFLLGVSLIIGVHEFGHYWVARRCGVKVLRFSIGFGRPLWTWRRGGTEYVVGLIPLGGYVRMLDEENDTVAEKDKEATFNCKSLAARTAIVAAGPVFNFILAWLLYAAVFMAGRADIEPVVHEVVADSPAMRAGVRPGDEIISVNGREIRGWRQLMAALFLQAGRDGQSLLELRDGAGVVREAGLDLSESDLLADEAPDIEREVGLYPWRPPAVIDSISEGGPAAASELRPGDRIVSLAGRAVATWSDFAREIRGRPDSVQPLVVERDGETLTFDLPLGSKILDGRRVGHAGVVARVDADAIAERQIVVRAGFFQAFARAAQTVADMTVATLRIVAAMLSGEAALTNLSGPVTIAQYAGLTFLAGVTSYLALLALLSLSIGIINLFPVPMLDGGHLLYNLVELVKGSPISKEMRGYAQIAGLAVISGLIGVALYSDIHRLFG